MKVIADQPISHPVANDAKVKDSAGEVPEQIGKSIKPGETFDATPEEYKAMKENGVKVHCADTKDEPKEEIAEKKADIKPEVNEEHEEHEDNNLS